MTALPPFALERFFARHEFTVEVNACASDVEAPAMAEVLGWGSDATREAWDGLRLGYTEAPGHPRLRAAIAGLYDGLEAEDVLVFAGAEEAIFAWAHTELGAGDHAVVVWPSYQSLHEVARATGAEVTLLELRHEDGWRLDLAALRAALRPGHTRAVVVNLPHNPTGAHLDPVDWEELVGLCGRLTTTARVCPGRSAARSASRSSRQPSSWRSSSSVSSAPVARATTCCE